MTNPFADLIPEKNRGTDGIATTFGYNDPEDNGIGAWGDRTNNPDIVGVSLPRQVLRNHFGDENAAHGAMVEILNPDTGKSVVAPILDKGPADWVVDRQGPTIDLTHAANQAIGGTGKTQVKYRILGHDVFADLIPDGPTPPPPGEMGGGDEDYSSGNPFADLIPKSELPTATPKMADDLGLQSWRDPLDQTEVRRAEVQSIPTPEEKPSTQSDWKDAANAFAGGIADSTLQTPQGLFTQAGKLIENLGPKYATEFGPNAKEYRDLRVELNRLKYFKDQEKTSAYDDRISELESKMQPLEKAGETAYNETAFPQIAQEYTGLADKLGEIRKEYSDFYNVDDDFQKSFGGKLIAAAGQMVPQIVAGSIGNIGLAALQSQAFQSSWDDAKATAERKGIPFDSNKAYAFAFTDSLQQALLERGGIDAALGKWFKEGGEKTLREGLKRVAVGALGEGGENVLQGVNTDTLAGMFGIEQRNPLDARKRFEDFAIGSILGGGLAGTHHAGGMAVEARQAQFSKQINKEAAQVEAKTPKEKPQVFKDFSEMPAPTDSPTGQDQVPPAGKQEDDSRFAPGGMEQPPESNNVENPTSDEELDKMMEEYSAEPVYAQKKEPESKPFTPEERDETPAKAENWLGILNAIAPGVAKRLGIVIDSRVESSRMMSDIETNLSGKPMAVEIPDTAHAAIHRNIVYLFNEALNSYQNRRAEGLRRFQHEFGHAWWETLGVREREALTRLWKAETQAKTGSLYTEDGKVKQEVMDGVEGDVQEWLGEKVAEENSDWANSKADATSNDGRMVSRIAAKIRGFLFDSRQAIFPNKSRTTIADEFRKVLKRGRGTTGGTEIGGGTTSPVLVSSGNREEKFAKRGQTLRDAERTMTEDSPETELANTSTGNAQIATNSADVVRSWPKTVIAADGSGIDLSVADQGSIARRVFHLIRNNETQTINAEKAAWLPRVVDTLKNAQARIIDQRERSRIFVRKYAGGVIHAVVVRPDGTVKSQEAFTGHLETQFPLASAKDSRQKHMIVDWVRPDIDEKGMGLRQTAPHPTPADSMVSGPRQKEFQPENLSDDTRSQGGKFASGKPIPATGPQIRPVIQVPLSVVKGLSGKVYRDWAHPAPGLDRLWKGTADIFDQTPGLQFLGQAIRKHVDRARMYQGQMMAPFREWYRRHGGKERKQAMKEFEGYFREQERNPILAGSVYRLGSQAGRELIDLWKDAANKTGDINQANNVQVWDGEQGIWRPIGRVSNYFPRMLNDDTLKILANPQRHVSGRSDLIREMIAEGLVKDEDEANKMVNQAATSYAANDHFGAIEKARSLQLPRTAYDYSFGTARKYLMAWAERMAQIEAFGQKVGSQGKDLFDRAQELTLDEPTKKYIKSVQDRAYGVRWDTPAGRFANSMNQFATGLQLGNPLSTIKNLLSGMTMAGAFYGTRRTMGALFDVRGAFDKIDDAYEKGIILDDLMNLMEDRGPNGRQSRVSSFTNFMLKVSGFNAAETWVRVVNMAAAQSFLRHAISSNLKNPGSRSSLQYRGFIARLGIKQVQALLDEGGDGPMTDSFLRKAVNEVQGGYRYDQVPAFMDSSAGRFFFKYQKWGSQQMRAFLRHVVNPFVQFVPGGKIGNPELIKYRDPKTGGVITKRVPGAIMPAIRYLILLAAGGAGTEELLNLLFGRPEAEASWSEIAMAMDKDRREAMGMALSKLWLYHVMAGSMGQISNYAQLGMDIANRSRFKNPLDPPALSWAKEAVDLGLDWKEQGKLTMSNIDNFLRGTLSVYRTAKDFSATQLNRAGTGFKWAKLNAARQDATWMRMQTARFDKTIGAERRMTQIDRVGKTEQTPFRDAIKEDLRVGDVQAARQRLEDWIASIPQDKRKVALRALAESVTASQPIRAGTGSGALRGAFLQWARTHLPKESVLRIQQIDRTYRDSAISLGLMKPGEPDSLNISKALAKYSH